MELFASLFQYPCDGYRAEAARCTEAYRSPELEQFARRISGLSTEQLQELYIQTFDLNPDCALDIGWHLFGENYERGEFLVKVRGEMRRYGVPESAELPDHLTHVLPLMARMEESDAAEFTAAFLLPALAKMLAALEGKDNPFAELLRGLQSIAQARTPALPGGIHA